MIAFAVIWYIVPALLCASSAAEGSFVWPRDRIDVWLSFALAVASIIVPVTLIPARRLVVLRREPNPPPVIMWAIASLTIVAGGLSYLQGNSSWRYAGDSASDRIAADGGGMLVATALLQAIGPMLAWWIMLMRPALWLEPSWTSRAARTLAALAAFSGVNGLNSAISSLFSTACMIWPRQFDRLIFSHAEACRPRGGLSAIVGVAILAVAFAAVGMVAKTGRSSEELWQSHTSYEFLVQRHAVHFQHAMGALEIGIDEASESDTFASRRQIGFQSTAFRIGVITGNPSWGERPDPASLSRWTIERFANYDLGSNTRGGSSPGLIGTFALCYAPPWNFVTLGLFSLTLALAINWFIRGCSRLSLLGCVAVAFIPVRLVTDLPTELLNPIGVSFAIVLLVVIARSRSLTSIAATHARRS